MILLADAVQSGIDDLAWLHARAYHDLVLLGSPKTLPKSLQIISAAGPGYPVGDIDRPAVP